MIWEIIKTIILGIVEGVTEWLPISSTGHLILVEELLNLDKSEEFKEMFDVVIQLGAIMAVVVIFWKKLWPFGRKNNAHPLNKTPFGKMIKTDIFMMWFKVLVACLPAAVIGLLLDDWIDEHLYNPWTVAVALIVFGIAFIIIENWNKGKKPKINTIAELGFNTAFIIGVFQLIAAIFPGTSRSGATIVGALLIGVSRTVAAEFTFYLAIPVMFGASLLKLVKFGFNFTGSELAVLITGMVVAFLVSVVVIKFLMDYIKKHDFKVFGWYRIVLGILVLIYFGAKAIIK
ncbi:undecaprenyl-diphosphate phosphatase [Ruminococcus sp.]|uniref:undecaprenyl-diphosphate phosphatase n=1 Tax=Ruminococcus sp. TaxID=41978 RepID=UPI0025E843E1|nr:undecaprenyl-diphosphate phosphatase [Ruminococcus sp.]MBQ6033946.1 undecaprenyl-diphosphate phosphatase [Ruminococcus sp.]MBQ6251321.1 undecaprenyl-diphosphate phosphatase [Ruminococcus sp.]MBR0511636.1 undecaprenyl-diphosphate phosphatase [Ruminococcus sp.]